MNVSNALSAAGDALAVLTLPGTLELTLLTGGSFLYRARAQRPLGEARAWLAVVIPAHNEEVSIAGCVRSVLACEGAGKIASVFVIADNCTDNTAAAARRAGATVLERNNPELRGKGHALDFAFRRLLPLGFDGFIVVDADSAVNREFLLAFSAAFTRGAEALQCAYLVSEPEKTPLQDLALRGFNLVRPQGREGLGASAGILGNGFGLSRAVLERVPYTADSVVEDLEYHIQLVRAGVRVEYLGGALVRGCMPESDAGRAGQRARWEGGRLRMALEKGPYILGRLLRGQVRFASLLLDLLTLPLAFHTLLLLLALALPSAFGRLVAAAGLGAMLFHLVAAMLAGHSMKQDLLTLLRVPAYILWKLRHLPRTVATSNRAAAWVRTARTQEEVTHA